MGSHPYVLVLDPSPGHARRLADVLQAGGLSAETAGTLAATREALRALPPPNLAWVTVDAPVALVREVVERHVPFVLALDERPCPPDLLDLRPRGAVKVGQAAAGIAEALRRVHDEESRQRTTEMWTAAIHDADVAVIRADFEGQIVAVNPSYARLAGGAPLDPVGMPLLEVVVPTEAGPGTARREEFAAALRGERPWVGDVVLTSGGQPVPCRATISRYRRPDGTDAGCVVVLMDAKEVAARETTLRETAEQFREQAARDPLTRLWNRAYLAATLEQELARCRRHGRPLTLLVLDLDKFRRVNNVHGHQEGDRVLLALARAMQESTRMGDILTRYAGDEFCVLLPDTGRVEAAKGAERLRECVRAVRTRGTGGGFISTSIGGACTEEFREAPSSAEFFSRADRRLQAAKSAGGDRVVLDDEPTSEPRSVEGLADFGVQTRLP